jgi:Holliday junction resolvasome RuvABC endonuclease subunit
MQKTIKKTVFIGIDPGVTKCSIGIIDSRGCFVSVDGVILWTASSLSNVFSIIKCTYNIKLVALESNFPRSNQGLGSTGKFMKACGTIFGLLVGLKIPVIEVVPQKWKRMSEDLKSDPELSKTENKKKALFFIQKLFPEANLKMSKEIDEADALCLAYYAFLYERDRNAAQNTTSKPAKSTSKPVLLK